MTTTQMLETRATITTKPVVTKALSQRDAYTYTHIFTEFKIVERERVREYNKGINILTHSMPI